VLSRLGGLFIFAPVLASPMIPRQAKALFVFMLAAAVYPLITGLGGPGGGAGGGGLKVALPGDVFSLLPIMFSEALIGAAIGLMALMPLVSVELSGTLIGNQIGFGLAQVYNPGSDTDTDLFGQLLFWVAMAAFIGMGGLEAMFSSVLATYHRLPIGLFGTGSLPLSVLVGVVSSGFELALRVAAPVLCLVFLELVAMGFLSKTMPQMNILTYGFAVKIVTAIGLLAISLGPISQVAGEEVSRVMTGVIGWAAGLTPQPG
jgi:flagellar biosynthetic protein FliR